VSSALRDLADELEDESLVEDSGFRPLLRWLGRDVARAGRQRTVELVAAETDQVVGLLASRFEAERDALLAVDPAALVETLRRAKERADALRATGSKWSGALTDAFGDLQSDVDHDLRARMRDLNRKVDELIDASDPADAWAEFEPWLRQEAGVGVTENYAMLVARVETLVADVSTIFGDEHEGAAFVARITAAEELIAQAGSEAALDMRKTGVVGQGMSVLRGGYGAVGMFSTYAGLAGIAIANPVSAALALVMGRKGLRDEKERQLGQRRSQAKAAARRYVDEVNFVVGKDARDTMRHLQRDLREHFTRCAEEANRSAADALAAAEGALKSSESERTQRLENVQAELARLAKLQDAATTLVGLQQQEAEA
jgi:hypothetical protein